MTQQRNATRAQATVTLTQLQKGLGADGITEADFTDEDEDEDEDDREKDKHRAPRVRHTSSPAANGDAAVCASVRGVARATAVVVRRKPLRADMPEGARVCPKRARASNAPTAVAELIAWCSICREQHKSVGARDASSSRQFACESR